MSNPEHTPAYKIFHYLYKCYMPQHHLYSDDFLSNVGIPTTGNRQIDRELAKNEVLCQLTISDMAEHFANGANLTLEVPSKSVEIYDTIFQHLNEWRQIVENPLNMTEAPVDDLRKLEELATEVYKIARGYKVKQLEQVNGRPLFNNRPASRQPQRPVADYQKLVNSDHAPISNLIANAEFERSKRWR